MIGLLCDFMFHQCLREELEECIIACGSIQSNLDVLPSVSFVIPGVWVSREAQICHPALRQTIAKVLHLTETSLVSSNVIRLEESLIVVPRT